MVSRYVSFLAMEAELVLLTNLILSSVVSMILRRDAFASMGTI